MSQRFIVIATILMVDILLGLSIFLMTVRIVSDLKNGEFHWATDFVTNSSVGTAIAGTVTAKAFTPTTTP
jgi:hypothetical protein